MDSAKLNEWAQVVGIVALVASLIFVGLQLKQGHEIALASTYQSRAQVTQEIQMTAASTPELTSAFGKMYTGRAEEITLEEFVALDLNLGAYMTGFENLHYQYSLGFLPEEHWQRNRKDLHCYLSLPFLRGLLHYYSFRDSFQAVIDEVTIEASNAPSDCWSVDYPSLLE